MELWDALMLCINVHNVQTQHMNQNTYVTKPVEEWTNAQFFLITIKYSKINWDNLSH